MMVLLKTRLQKLFRNDSHDMIDGCKTDDIIDKNKMYTYRKKSEVLFSGAVMYTFISDDCLKLRGLDFVSLICGLLFFLVVIWTFVRNCEELCATGKSRSS